jgi:hypothetical protein
MTREERVQRLGSLRHGLTDRQAEFLVTVMLHSGWCFQRHYAAFAGIPHGRKIVDFFESLVNRGYATPWPCLHYRARAFHVHYKPLYRAIGEENNRHRRPVALPRALERMMLLDAVLAKRDGTWLATEDEKVGHFLLTHRVPREDLPSLTFRAAGGETARFFADKLPINIDPDGRTYTFLYLVTQDLPIDFRRFLERHGELLRALPEWVIALLVPAHMTHAIPLYQSAFYEHLATPLRLSVMEELKWYFRARQRRSSDDDQRFDEAGEAFGAPRFQMLYREWLDRGDSMLGATVLTTLADAIERGNGRLECHVSPHKYLHLAPLVGTA